LEEIFKGHLVVCVPPDPVMSKDVYH